jgi:predicted deacylase
LIRGEAPRLPRLRNEATPLRGVAHIKAEVPGIVVFLKQPGNRVARGETIAEIVNPLPTGLQNGITAVKSTIEGLLFSITTEHYARPGHILAKIAGRTPFKAKGADLLTV